MRVTPKVQFQCSQIFFLQMDFENDTDFVLSHCERAGDISKLLSFGLSQNQSSKLISEYSIKKLSVLYDSDVDKQSPSNFHKKVDGKGPTICIIKKDEVLFLPLSVSPSSNLLG